mmetsp:Transcript_6663/g.15109  ORF Transcript_6663/g.15109 Transcript_6663/m.15109 type:complete len:799 (+) Transcript_6663:59-2455(+)|eukprot:CAMPEP_0172306006 /NCGR_PEP_ID=MMETSP1058-20130122/7179_1 /TAXON_ID=83371 /ORGANISM="Detonula confervacea, Strain CCMP 353" /LENGTH=798 /DNA_ID=CAMNT_0013017777 /DNA_START=50 /DNA_END=2449 /DNA_ORIENTATION=+
MTMMAAATLAAVLLSVPPPTSLAFTPSLAISRTASIVPTIAIVGYGPRRKSSSSRLHAAKRKKNKDKDKDSGSGDSSENQWYEDVNDNASPEDVFWDEMERRRLLSMSGVGESYSLPDGGNGPSPIDMVGMMDKSMNDGAYSSSSGTASNVASQSAASSAMGGDGLDDFMGPGSNTAMSMKNPGVPISEERNAYATLASYEVFAVSNNFLYNDDDDEMSSGMLRNDPSLWEGEDPTLEEENAELNRQIDELERELMGDGIDGSVVGGSSPFFDPSLSDEPWDRYGQSMKYDDSEDSDEDGPSIFHKELERKMKMVSESAKEFTLDYDEEHPEEAEAEAEREEEEYVKSLSSIGITSPRLENAAVNPKAEEYFQRPPDERQGYDTMWVSAIDTPCVKNLYGIFSNYGVQFAENFDDWDDGSSDEDGLRSIEDIASYKARKIFQVTGLPCVASRTSFEVEPIRPEDMDKTNSDVGGVGDGGGGGGGKKVKQGQKSPRVVTGYRFNNIGKHVDNVVQSLLPFSEPTRVTRFRSCVCYYDGEMELFEYGELDCDLYFSGSMRTFISMSAAINSMLKSLELALDLQYQKWLHSKVNDATGGGKYSDASIKLRDRVLKEAKVLPNDIIDVSSFMDAMVDVNLMDECGRELAERFISEKPSKILTIATTGLVIGIPMAKYLQVPLVYARKKRSVVMADTFDAGYNSKTIGQDQQLLVSRDHIDEEDRVLIVDDFLSSGSSQEALLRIISEAGATAVGVGVLLEKEYEAGRVSLSGFGVPVESVVRIASVKDGVIQLLEEDGYDNM